MRIIRRKLLVLGFYSVMLAVAISAHFSELIYKLIFSPISLAMCFATLGLITSDYLTPNLAVISKELLFISDRVSGMTLLALGNAIPDITSTYKAMKKDVTTLAIGESLGAIFFLLTVVIGSMLLVRNIKLSTLGEISLSVEAQDNMDLWDTIYYNRRQFLRDLFMFAFLILMNIFLLRDGKIMFWECFVMCLTYCFYAIYLISSISEPKVANPDENVPDIVISDQPNEEVNMERFLRTVKDTRNDVRKKIRKYLRKNYQGWANLKLNDTLDLWENGVFFNHEVDEAISNVTSPAVRPLVRSNSETNYQHIQNIPDIVFNDNMADTNEVTSANTLFIKNNKTGGAKNIEDTESNDGNVSLNPFDRLTSLRSVSADNLRLMTEQSSIMDDISELNLELTHGIVSEPEDRWESKLRIFKYLSDPTFATSNMELAIILATTPIMFVLTLVIPLHYASKASSTYFKAAYYTQCAFSPFLTNLLMTRSFNIWLFILGALASAILLPLFFYNVLKIKAKYISLFGFLLSISAISFVVGLVIDILTDWIEVFNISEAILGLTVFAWGNSIGDLVSNVTFTRIGVLEIALGSCFGSPLLYFLFGVGFDGMIVLFQRSHPSDVSIWFRHIDFQVDHGLVCLLYTSRCV